MSKMRSKLTVLFEDPFWVGVYERRCGKQYEASKIVFGAEPKDYEVYELMLANWGRLRFGTAMDSDTTEEKPISPKRMQRVIRRQMQQKGIGTKAQQALKLSQQQKKMQRKSAFREQDEAQKERQFEMKQQKRKMKHRGK